MAKTKIKKIPQDQAELKAMADFYGQSYQEVYFVRDILADCIIAVECFPYNPTASAAVERSKGKRNIFGYQELFFTTRLRLDTNEFGQRMVGYESRSGNDTRLAAVERGDVPVVSAKKGTPEALAIAQAPPTMSPFERSQLQTDVQQRQAKSKQKADYEQYVDSEGHAVERFETFEIVRMK